MDVFFVGFSSVHAQLRNLIGKDSREAAVIMGTGLERNNIVTT